MIWVGKKVFSSGKVKQGGGKNWGKLVRRLIQSRHYVLVREWGEINLRRQNVVIF